jgi:outer membrane protein assembly factor BamB
MTLAYRDLALIINGLGKTELYAVRADGTGDVTKTHVAWKLEKGIAKTASPVIVDDLFYMVRDDGVVTCLEAATGNQVWSQPVGGHFAASPVYADGRLYFCNEQGKTFVIKPGRTCELLATNQLAIGCMASPAVSGRALFLRTKTHLYRIESGASAK